MAGGIFRRRPQRKRRRSLFFGPRSGIVAFTRALETDAANGFPKVVVIGKVTETDSAKSPFTAPVGTQVSETGRFVYAAHDERGNLVISTVVSERGERVVTGYRISTGQSVSIGIALEIDDASSLARVNKVSETDVANTIDPYHVLTPGKVQTTETAGTFVIWRTKLLGGAYEYDTVGRFGGGFRFLTSYEVDYALVIAARKLAPNRGIARASDSQASRAQAADRQAAGARGSDS